MSLRTQCPSGPTRGFALPRWLVIVAGALLVLIVAGAVTLKVLFPAEKLRAMVVPRIEERLGREVQLSSVKLRIFPRIAVRLDDLAIANPPGFSARPMLELDALELDLRLWPLLRREVELGQVRLVRPVIRYEVLADGTSNFQGLGGAEGEAERAPAAAQAGGDVPPEAAAAGAFFVSDLRLTQGTLLYSDARVGRGARMAIEARGSVDRPAGGGVAMESRGTIGLGDIRALDPGLGPDSIALPDLAIEYEVFADLQGDSIIVRDLRLTAGELPLYGSGSIHRLSSERLLAFHLESEDIDIAGLLASLPPAMKKKVGALDASGSARLSIAASGSMAAGSRPAVDGTIAFSNLGAAHAEYGRTLTDGSGELSFDAASLSLPSFEAQLFGRPFRLQLAVRDFESPVAEGRATGSIDLAQLAEMRGDTTPMSGLMSFDIRFAGPAKQPERLRLTGPVELKKVRYQSASLAVPAVITAATIQLTGDGLATDGIPVTLGTSDVTLSFSAPGVLAYALSAGKAPRSPPPPPTVEFRLTSEKLDMSELTVESEEIGYGDLVSARLAGVRIDGRDPGELAREKYPPPPIPPLNMRGSVRIGELLNPPTRVRNLSFNVRVKDGELRIRNLNGRAYGGRLSGGLTLDVSGGQPPFALEYDLDLKNAQAGAFVRRWTRLGSAVSGLVDFSISGSAAIDEAMLPAPEALVAAGVASFREGRFENFGLMDALASRLNLDTQAMSGFRDLGGTFEIVDGNFLLEGWEFASGDLSGKIGGVAGLGGSLDLTLDLAIPMATLEKAGLVSGGGLGDLIGQLAGTDEAIDLSVGVGGTMSSPVIRLDTEALERELARRLEGKGRDLLRRFLRPPPDTSRG